jgi:hypothetical protein
VRNNVYSIPDMKKIDILNFITDFRKSPNNTKTYAELLTHLGPANEILLKQLLAELQNTKVIRETEENGQKIYWVVHR